MVSPVSKMFYVTFFFTLTFMVVCYLCLVKFPLGYSALSFKIYPHNSVPQEKETKSPLKMAGIISMTPPDLIIGLVN